MGNSLSSPDAVLYHYTSQQGLIGILQKREIWTTKIQMLNDAAEMTYASDLLTERLDVLEDVERPKEEKEAIREIRQFNTALDNLNIFTASFSPFCKIRIAEDGSPLPVTNIVVGPTPHPRQAEAAAQGLYVAASETAMDAFLPARLIELSKSELKGDELRNKLKEDPESLWEVRAFIEDIVGVFTQENGSSKSLEAILQDIANMMSVTSQSEIPYRNW